MDLNFSLFKRSIAILLLFGSFLGAREYNFLETRYSDALGQSIKLSGTIEFDINSLRINYPKKMQEIVYKNGELQLYREKELQELDPQQESQIGFYMQILLMLYKEDTRELERYFSIEKDRKLTLLIPKAEFEKILQQVKLYKNGNRIDKIVLLMRNNDSITIDIDAKVR